MVKLTLSPKAAMGKIILLMLLAMVSGNTAAEWVPAGRSTLFAAYYDPATIRRVGNMVAMLHLYDFNAPRQSAIGETYFSSLEQDEYDCKEQRVRIVSFSWHSDHMGSGAVVNIDSGIDKWLPVPPKSIYAALWKVACGK
jgi:hypothetical protein